MSECKVVMISRTCGSAVRFHGVSPPQYPLIQDSEEEG